MSDKTSVGEQSSHILLIEDDDSVRLGVVENLKNEGYRISECDNGLAGLEVLKDNSPDIVILDVMMPGIDGFEVCRRIRSANPAIPIIMLTAKCAEIDRVVGLELGADDYLTKPFGMRELVARVKAVLRRSGLSNSQTEQKELSELRFFDVVIDFKSYRVTRGSEALSLSAKEFELLKYLASRPDIAVSRNQLLDSVWGYNSYPSTRTVDNFIARLRNKLEPFPDDPQLILTVHGVGYKFVFPCDDTEDVSEEASGQVIRLHRR